MGSVRGNRRAHQQTLFLRQKHERPGSLIQAFQRRELQKRRVLRHGDKHRPVSCQRHPGIGQIVGIRQKQDRRIGIPVMPQIADAVRRIGSVLFEPLFLRHQILPSLGKLCQVCLIKCLEIPGAHLLHREPAHRDPVDGFHVTDVPVLPGGAVHCLGGQHLHLIPIGKMLGDFPGIGLAAAADLQSIPGMHQCDSLHLLTLPSASGKMSGTFLQ